MSFLFFSMTLRWLFAMTLIWTQCFSKEGGGAKSKLVTPVFFVDQDLDLNLNSTECRILSFFIRLTITTKKAVSGAKTIKIVFCVKMCGCAKKRVCPENGGVREKLSKIVFLRIRLRMCYIFFSVLFVNVSKTENRVKP